MCEAASHIQLPRPAAVTLEPRVAATPRAVSSPQLAVSPEVNLQHGPRCLGANQLPRSPSLPRATARAGRA